jgi:hypothetical protein
VPGFGETGSGDWLDLTRNSRSSADIPSSTRGRVAARLFVAPGSATRSYSSGFGARTSRKRSLRHAASGLQPNARRGYSVSEYTGRSDDGPPSPLRGFGAAGFCETSGISD